MLQHLPGAHHIADYLLATAKLDYGVNLDQLQINRFCYLVNGFVLQDRDEPAFYNKIEAWRYGPVIPEVYDMFKSYENNSITHLDLCRTPLNNQDKVSKRWEELISVIGRDVASIASGVIRSYIDCDNGLLVGMTRMKGSPWKKAYRPGHNNVIRTKNIKKFYRDLDEEDAMR